LFGLFRLFIPALGLVVPDPVLVPLPVVLELPWLLVAPEVPLELDPLLAPALPPPEPPAPPPPPPPPWARAAVLRASADINTTGNSLVLDIAISIAPHARATRDQIGRSDICKAGARNSRTHPARNCLSGRTWSARSRLASKTSRPPNFSLINVAPLTPCLRHTSAFFAPVSCPAG
jgi:hypothetical protein